MNIKINNRSVLDKVQEICLEQLKPDDFVVDMTVGNGHDTLFLASIISKGLVVGFDIQQKAIDNTTNLLQENNITNYKLFLENHENIDKYLDNYKNKISLFLFNLGYLPGGNKKITTTAKSTLNATIKSLNILKSGGLILMVCYPHPEGLKESTLIKDYLNKNNISFNEYHNTDKEYAPFLLEIKKK